ncbi:hypothetical protein SCP_0508170 [Sparassis crispa]|uniref:Uncharacterized protein n=1 Tax=Sparassis crispa TaxID=139825 RepID=A0A401GNE5_9APHY|nr:hypothetical protein SCP_0508170 [Sparassis crispa]GBE83761.1 hypothetical protein SCP_0508170 [Sparassis crispa]
MSMSRILLPLNDTVIIFLDPDDGPTSVPHVVQVTVKSDGPETVDTIASYFKAQHDIADLVLGIVSSHLQSPLPSIINFEDPRYTLMAKHREWCFGMEKLRFAWGEDEVVAWGRKWMFAFRPRAYAAQV